MKLKNSLKIFSLCLSVGVFFTLPSFSEVSFTKGKVTIPFTPSITIKDKNLKQKDKSEITINFKLEEQSYIYKESLNVSFDANSNIKNSSPIYPKAEKKFDKFSNHDKEIYSKDFSIKVPIQLDNAKLGKNEIKVKVGYQGCSLKRGICFLPQKKELLLSLDIKK